MNNTDNLSMSQQMQKNNKLLLNIVIIYILLFFGYGIYTNTQEDVIEEKDDWDNFCGQRFLMEFKHPNLSFYAYHNGTVVFDERPPFVPLNGRPIQTCIDYSFDFSYLEFAGVEK